MKALVFTLILLEIAQFVYLFVLRRDYIHHKAITDENIKTLLNGLKQHKESIEQMDMRDKISSIEDNIKR